jgi:TPR repeat protein
MIDRGLAVDWLTISAEQDNADAHWLLGTLLRDGDIVAHDPIAAVHHFERSAALGHSIGKTCLANALLVGCGISQDCARAVELLREAIEQPTARWTLANCLLRGIGCQQDEVAACRLFKTLADEGDRDGCYQYGKLLINGVRIGDRLLRNQREGVAQIARAEELGHSLALVRLGEFCEKGYSSLAIPSHAFSEQQKQANLVESSDMPIP